MKEIELYETIDLVNLKQSSFEDAKEYSKRTSDIDFTFLFIEIKSNQPPTNCELVLQFRIKPDNSVKTVHIHFIKYLREFKYENGYYVLSFDVINEIGKDTIPLFVEYKNKRDLESTAKLFYKTNFQSQ